MKRSCKKRFVTVRQVLSGMCACCLLHREKATPTSHWIIAVINSLRPLVRELIIGNCDNDPIRIGNPKANIETLAARYRPDVMIVLEGMNLSLNVVDRIRHMGIRTAIWLTDDPYYTDITAAYATHYDFLFTLEVNCVQFYQEMGCQQVHYLPLAFQPEMFRPKPCAKWCTPRYLFYWFGLLEPRVACLIRLLRIYRANASLSQEYGGNV